METWQTKAMRRLEHSRKQWSIEKVKNEVKAKEKVEKAKIAHGGNRGYSVSPINLHKTMIKLTQEFTDK